MQPSEERSEERSEASAGEEVRVKVWKVVMERNVRVASCGVDEELR